MAAKFFFVLCASALFVNTISAQCIGYGNGYRNGYGNYGGYGGCGCGASNYGGLYAPQIAAGSGGCLSVASASPIAPNGISLVSDNAIEGVLDVGGQLPLLAAVAFEGQMPSAGSAGVSYSCGNGNVGISGESLAAAGLGNGIYGAGSLGRAGYGAAGLAGAAGLNAGLYGAGLAGGRIGSSCGCGGIY